MDSSILENQMDLIVNSLNAVIAWNLMNGPTFHRGIIGAAGVITSSIQLWQLFRNETIGLSLAQRLNIPKRPGSADMDVNTDVEVRDEGVFDARSTSDTTTFSDKEDLENKKCM